jgi:hypothetical protein
VLPCCRCCDCHHPQLQACTNTAAHILRGGSFVCGTQLCAHTSLVCPLLHSCSSGRGTSGPHTPAQCAALAPAPLGHLLPSIESPPSSFKAHMPYDSSCRGVQQATPPHGPAPRCPCAGLEAATAVHDGNPQLPPVPCSSLESCKSSCSHVCCV